ncbi:hypothetical protein [Myceligenerans crystallogenes]|uniref:Interferon-induced transmembrane protein n=1 Tax=Myceligenerans crystallogenes TaxID=316335 RepID=A0ABN2NGK9_9MICO
MTSPDIQTSTPEPTKEAPETVTQQVATAVSEATGQEVTTTADATPAAAAYEEPTTVVFSLVGFFLAYIPLVGVIVNAIAVAKAGKEGFDLFVAKWGLILAILSTIGAAILIGLGFWLGLEAGRGSM